VDRIAEAVVTFVVNAAWQSSIIALIGISAARLLRRAPASLRFWLAALTMIAAVGSPLMSIVPRQEATVASGVSTSFASNPVASRGGEEQQYCDGGAHQSSR